MSKQINYKRPRVINPVSISLVVIAGLLAYLASLYLPNWLVQQETLRVLDAMAKRFQIHRSKFMADDKSRESLQYELSRAIRSAGVIDPQMEVWIEVDETLDVRLGVIYSQTWPMPFDLAPAKERVVEQEHLLPIN